MAKQILECSGAPINANLSGVSNMKIVADKIEFDGREILFYFSGKVVLTLTLKKSYSSIYDALSGSGIVVSGY
jgi:hypothetical protein